jgi:hypothetical protein
MKDDFTQYVWVGIKFWKAESNKKNEGEWNLLYKGKAVEQV